MQRLCDKYNRAIDSIHQLVGGLCPPLIPLCLSGACAGVLSPAAHQVSWVVLTTRLTDPCRPPRSVGVHTVAWGRVLLTTSGRHLGCCCWEQAGGGVHSQSLSSLLLYTHVGVTERAPWVTPSPVQHRHVKRVSPPPPTPALSHIRQVPLSGASRALSQADQHPWPHPFHARSTQNVCRCPQALYSVLG